MSFSVGDSKLCGESYVSTSVLLREEVSRGKGSESW